MNPNNPEDLKDFYPVRQFLPHKILDSNFSEEDLVQAIPEVGPGVYSDFARTLSSLLRTRSYASQNWDREHGFGSGRTLNGDVTHHAANHEDV